MIFLKFSFKTTLASPHFTFDCAALDSLAYQQHSNELRHLQRLLDVIRDGGRSQVSSQWPLGRNLSLIAGYLVLQFAALL